MLKSIPKFQQNFIENQYKIFILQRIYNLFQEKASALPIIISKIIYNKYIPRFLFRDLLPKIYSNKQQKLKQQILQSWFCFFHQYRNNHFQFLNADSYDLFLVRILIRKLLWKISEINSIILSKKNITLMSKPEPQKRTSLQTHEVLVEMEKNSNKGIPSIEKIDVSEKSIKRKGGLKPEAQRLYSEKKIMDENKGPTSTKSIKSSRSIQFRSSNQFQRFTYVKDQGQSRQHKPKVVTPPPSNTQDQMCTIM